MFDLAMSTAFMLHELIGVARSEVSVHLLKLPAMATPAPAVFNVLSRPCMCRVNDVRLLELTCMLFNLGLVILIVAPMVLLTPHALINSAAPPLSVVTRDLNVSCLLLRISAK